MAATDKAIRKRSAQSVIGVIPARGGSQRLPGKNIMPIYGKPLIAYTIEAAIQASVLQRVFVSTDNQDIATIARQFGAEVVIRPKELSTNEAPIDDALRHVLGHLREKESLVADIVVLMQANNPVRKPHEIDEVVNKLQNDTGATAVATAYKVTQRPEWAKRLVDREVMEIRPLQEPGQNYRMQDLPDLYLLDGSTIAIRTCVLEKTSGDRRVHAYLGDRVRIHVHHARYAVEIDEADNLELAEYYLSRL